MKILLPLKPQSKISAKIARSARCFLAICLTAGLFLAAASINGAMNHAPFISWLPDQRITTTAGGGFQTKYFRIIDLDARGFSVSRQSLDTGFLPNNDNYVKVSACDGTDTGCAQDGTGYKVEFPTPPQNGDGMARILIKATENVTGAVGATSFTVRLDSTGPGNAYPPNISSLPNEAIQLPSSTGQAVYKAQFVIGDLDSAAEEDVSDEWPEVSDFEATSSNSSLIGGSADGAVTFTVLEAPANVGFAEGPRSWLLTATSTAGNPSPTGTAVITVKLTDPEGNSTSTSFVVQVISNSNVPPTISNDPTLQPKVYVECADPTPTPLPVFYYHVTNDTGTNLTELKLIATSSNTNLVPNDYSATGNFKITGPDSNGNGTIKVIPMLPLPSPGIPQTSTITLSVIDDKYVRQTSFLYVVTPQGAAATSFSRPSGVYLLDPKQSSDHRPGDAFLTGEMRRVSWNDLESEPINGVDQFRFGDVLPAVFSALPSTQDLSLNLKEEPCYIAHNPPPGEDNRTWCDTDPGHTSTCVETCGGTLRAVPWNTYLRKRRNNFLFKLQEYLTTNGYMGRISIVNPNLPGGDTGIRNLSVDFELMDGYSREALLGAVQDELHNVQKNFPGKLVQIGFFKATDAFNSSYNGTELWQWLYKDANNWVDANGVTYTALADEFNGIIRSRASFFQEDLAAARGSGSSAPPPASNAPNYITPANATAYTFTPSSCQIPPFAYYCDFPGGDCDLASCDRVDGSFNNGMTFQANTPWISPYLHPDGEKLFKTHNGSPNDGMEAAFNAYLSQYLEVYQPDVDQAQPQNPSDQTWDAVLWKGQLQSWNDYTDHLRSSAPIERAPAGLTVERTSGTNNLIKWEAVYAGDQTIHYTVQRKSGSQWSDVCSDTTNTQCTDTTSTGSVYIYRVQAWKGTTYDVNAPWGYVAVFLSESSYDGYVTTDVEPPFQSGAAAYPNATQPGIRAGQTGGSLQDPGFDMRGFLSFNTSSLSGFTVRGAKLRLKQYNTSNSAFDTLGTCMVDIEKGVFNSSPTLEVADFSFSDTNTAAHIANIPPAASPPDWVVAELNPNGVSHINNVSFGRTQFRIYFDHADEHETWVGWYSGETVSSNPSTPPQLIVQYTP